MPDLSKILEDSRPAIQAGLAQAEQELADLDARRRELVQLIARAKAALGESPSTPPPVAGERLTLHQAIELVLSGRNNEWMTVHELASEINSRQLYTKRDQSDVDPSQIHARTNKYPHLFEKNGPNIRLRPAAAD
jgi:chorismate mutase